MAVGSSLTQNNITWTFDTDYTYGQYANGDYWVVAQGGTPKVTVSAIGHTNAAGTIADQVNSWINPRFDYEYSSSPLGQGYDSRADRYQAALNSQPSFELTPGDSVVSVISLTVIGGDEGTYLSDAAVLTCVDVEQPAGTMRPPYCRPTRETVSANDTLRYNISQIDWSKIPSLAPPASVPALATTTASVAKVWLDNCESNQNNARIRPLNNCNDYGRDIGFDVSVAALQLCLNYTQEQKQALMYGFLQIGIDTYGIVLDNGRWYAAAGHNHGRHFPLTFAGYILGVAGMNTFSMQFTHNSAQEVYRFAEDGQTYYYNDADVPDYINAMTMAVEAGPGDGIYACKGVKGWIDIVNGGTGDLVLHRMQDINDSGVRFYGQEHINAANWNPAFLGDYEVRCEVYRRCCSVRSWIGYYIVAKMFGAAFKTLYRHDAWYDYCERWMTQEDGGLNTPVDGAEEILQTLIGSDPTWEHQTVTGSEFVNDMWDLYHDYEYDSGSATPWVMIYG